MRSTMLSWNNDNIARSSLDEFRPAIFHFTARLSTTAAFSHKAEDEATDFRVIGETIGLYARTRNYVIPKGDLIPEVLSES